VLFSIKSLGSDIHPHHVRHILYICSFTLLSVCLKCPCKGHIAGEISVNVGLLSGWCCFHSVLITLYASPFQIFLWTNSWHLIFSL